MAAMDTSDDGGSETEAVSFRVLVKKIERYMADSKFKFVNSVDTPDIFDLTLSTTSRQLKCVLHPSMNEDIYHGKLKVSSIIQINDYSCHVDETQTESSKFHIITSLSILTDGESISSSISDSFFRTQYARNKPLITAREYYLPLYNNEDIYGQLWDIHLKQMNTISLDASKTNIQTLGEKKSDTKFLPVTGTVVTKSKLTHFGKKTDSNKFPFVFSIEIEHNGWTCSVSFWNNSCLDYFKNIKVGQNIVLWNYRLKNRYGKRSNTVFGLSKDAGIELSINPAKPKGEVHLLDLPASRIVYKFKTSTLLRKPLVLDSIIDIVGCVCFIGRYEREKKKLVNQPLSSGDFWMYRWIFVKDASSPKKILLKVYSCSQNYNLEELAIGDIFIATRMLYKVNSVQHCGKQIYASWMTTTRESQLYRISRQWNWDEVKLQPFASYKEVLDVLKLSRNDPVYELLLKDSYEGGYFTYPFLSDTFHNYRASFPIGTPLEIISTDVLRELVNQMHIHQSIRVCIQATIAVIEIIGGEQNESTQYHVIDKEALQLCDKIEKISSLDVITKDTKISLLGKRDNIDSRAFLRLSLVSLNKNNCIVSYFIPKFDETSKCQDIVEVLQGHVISEKELQRDFKNEFLLNCMKAGERFLFVLDIYYKEIDAPEVVINRGFKM